MFLYDQVLNQPVSMIEGVVRAARPRKLLVVLTPEEVGRVLARLSGVYWLIACLRYGSGLRLIESVRLRVKDLDFQHRAVVVRDGKGGQGPGRDSCGRADRPVAAASGGALETVPHRSGAGATPRTCGDDHSWHPFADG